MSRLRSLLALLRSGRDLRHVPVVYPGAARSTVRLLLRDENGVSRDVTGDHVPVSMRPLVLGVRATREQPAPTRPLLEIHDEAAGRRALASISLRASGAIEIGDGALQLYRTVGCRNRCAALPRRWLRYALAWRHAQLAPRRGDGLCMSASDLRCLNAYYISARPVYLVSVAHEGRNNFFPMDLVGPLSSGEFLLALRATSPAIALMEGSRRLALSAAPADRLSTVYALGAHHRKETVDTTALPFATQPSPCFGLPSIVGGLVREIAIDEVHRVGSHVLFVGRIVGDHGAMSEQLAHVSLMYMEWASRLGRELRLAT